MRSDEPPYRGVCVSPEFGLFSEVKNYERRTCLVSLTKGVCQATFISVTQNLSTEHALVS